MCRNCFVAADGQEINISAANTTDNYPASTKDGYSSSKLEVVLSSEMLGGWFMCRSYQEGLADHYNITTAEVVTGYLCEYIFIKLQDNSGKKFQPMRMAHH